jgi:hypothetical protein
MKNNQIYSDDTNVLLCLPSCSFLCSVIFCLIIKVNCISECILILQSVAVYITSVSFCVTRRDPPAVTGLLKTSLGLPLHWGHDIAKSSHVSRALQGSQAVEPYLSHTQQVRPTVRRTCYRTGISIHVVLPCECGQCYLRFGVHPKRRLHCPCLVECAACRPVARLTLRNTQRENSRCYAMIVWWAVNVYIRPVSW